MSLRLALYDLVERHGLDAVAAAELDHLAGIGTEPADARKLVLRALVVVASGLVGLGVLMWIAANWGALSRVGQFALLQSFVAVAAFAAWALPRARAALGLLALLGIGGLFAFFGQTYQTGADPWQLFALWALLALPLALVVASDAVWMPWSLVSFAAIALWVHANTGHDWRVEPRDLWAYAIAWAVATALLVSLAGPLRHRAGAGLWSYRATLLMTVAMITTSGLGGLFQHHVAAHYPLALLFLAVLAGFGARPRWFDFFALSAAVFGLNVLLDAGLGRALFDSGHGGDPIGRVLLLGLVAAGLLAASASGILALARQQGAAEAGAQ